MKAVSFLKLMTPKNLEAILELARKFNVKRLRADGIDIELGPPPPVQVQMTDDQFKKVLQQAETEMPSDEDIRMWSAGGPLPSEVRKAEQAAVEISRRIDSEAQAKKGETNAA